MKTVAIVLCVCALAVLSGCGNDNGKTKQSSTTDFNVRIRVDEGTGKALKAYRTTCTKTVTTGCAPGMFTKLTKLAARSPMQACTQVYGGPEVAEITGTVGGKPYKQLVGRSNGCGIADWTSTVQPLIDLSKKK